MARISQEDQALLAELRANGLYAEAEDLERSLTEEDLPSVTLELVAAPFPLVHLNGTPRDRLLHQYREANYELGEVITTLLNAHPNQRDYYPLGDAAWKSAVASHESMVSALNAVSERLVALIEHIDSV